MAASPEPADGERGAPTTVRPAWPSDLAAVAEIYAHYVTGTAVTFDLEPPSRADWSRRFWAVAEAGLPFLVAELDDQVVGYGYCAPWKSRPGYRGTVEESIYVAPSAHRRGVGSALLAQLLTACAAAGVRDVLAVVVDTGDPSSTALHTRHGFSHAGRLRGVGSKLGRRWDTLLLQCELRVAERVR